MAKKVLEVKNLSVPFHTFGGEVKALRAVNCDVRESESLALGRESSSGKSVSVECVMQLIDMPAGEFKSGEVLLEGEDLIQKTAKQMEGIRGKEMGMIFQDPMTSLNPTMKIGRQITEGLIKHQGLSKT